MKKVESLTSTFVFHDHFKIKASIHPSKAGLIISVIFENRTPPGGRPSPSIEIWFPIGGHLEYILKTRESEYRVIVDHLYDIGIDEKTGPWNYLVKPGKGALAIFYCKIPPRHFEQMKEIADKYGFVTIILNLYFSALYNAETLKAKTYKYHPIFEFNVPKIVLENWITIWASSYAEIEELPSSVPNEVLSDYIEAVKSFNVGAYKATVAMARRALQQALEDKGATKQTKLLDQIRELENKGLLDKATASLAHGIRQFGNYGAHPQTDLLANVTHDDARLAIDVLRKILKVLYGSQNE